MGTHVRAANDITWGTGGVLGTWGLRWHGLGGMAAKDIGAQMGGLRVVHKHLRQVAPRALKGLGETEQKKTITT